jgi:hypothetical protein
VTLGLYCLLTERALGVILSVAGCRTLADERGEGEREVVVVVRCVLENTAFLCVFIKQPSLSVKTNVIVVVVVGNTKHDLLILLLTSRSREAVVRYPREGKVNEGKRCC